MKSKWVLILSATLSILTFGGVPIANAQPSGLLASNPIHNKHNERIGHPSQNETSLNNKDIPALLRRAGIPIENILISDNIRNSFLPHSVGNYQWHTFYGSANDDFGVDITLDGSGNIYIIGYSSGSWNGPSGQAPQHAYSGNNDIMLLKLDNSGAYQWHTFYGSSGSDFGGGIALDGYGGVYITGSSASTWNGSEGQPPLHPYNGFRDVTVIKLDNSGSYLWHTFYGSSGPDDGIGITLDGVGGIYITGVSGGTWNGSEGQPPLHSYNGSSDITVIKLDNSGSYQWHTFYGSTNVDTGKAIALDVSGGVYLAGDSYETWNGPSGELPLHGYSGEYDIMILKLDHSGSYQWHTFYGSSGYDFSSGIALDGDGGVYVTGSSANTWNGSSGELPLHAYSGDYDIMVLKLDNSGAYQWHTFYGSAGADYGNDIGLYGNVGIYIAGNYSTDFVGLGDVMVLKLDSSGAYQWDIIYNTTSSSNSAITLDGKGGVYTTGQSFTTWNGPDGQAPLHPFTDSSDIMALKLHDSGIGYSTFLPILVK